jgi:hypothetical protein
MTFLNASTHSSKGRCSVLSHQTDPFLRRLRTHYLSQNAGSKYQAIENFANSLPHAEWESLNGDSPNSPEEREVFDLLQKFAERCGPEIDRAAFRRMVLSSQIILEGYRFKILDAMRSAALAEHDQALLSTVEEGRGCITYKLRVRFLALSRKNGDDELGKRISHWAVLNRKFQIFETLTLAKGI